MPATDKYPDLLPCPHCAGTDLGDRDWWSDDGDMDAIECADCLAAAPADVWNIRAASISEPQRIRQTLKHDNDTPEGAP